MRWLNVLVIFATFFSYLSPLVNPNQFWIFSFFGLIYPWLLLSNIIFIIYWGIKKRKYLLFSLGSIVLGWGHFKSFVGFNFATQIPSEKVVTIGSYNIHGLIQIQREKDKAEKKKQMADLKQLLDAQKKVDILCTQETGSLGFRFIEENLNLPFVHTIKGKGAAIFSKYQILNFGEIDFDKTTNSCLWADIKIENETFRVYSVHLQSNHVSTVATKVIKEKEIGKKETFKDVKSMMGRFRFFVKVRVNQAQSIADHMNNCPYPIILCGDFNDTPQSYTYQILTQNLKDTFKEKGRGLGTTYAGSIPALRIDYILTDEELMIYSHEILRTNYSDHYPVICKISL
ncbi:MAG: endonuclease/exonuclease/phosphatase family protein [Bacteroidota bacterium]